ncbi:restriction endonuclease subunit S [Salipaludibacillus sp. LMS25]|jgi:type I restriction enzyme S subunit|uniref:restriction endonuclease subunit S n=1 Tax=Salipaludibacillus sp. LMS25 TaxID=2924031 RepID=UPI0020D1E3F3|nr:restriction endonuclease subunit S [Salipaludibacillus sp. LMS25]UTR16775.1 restriction endonuclease subunit S [Salipaludibacillus sp. LMS25]
MSKKAKKQKTVEELLEEALVPEEEQTYEVPENWVWVKLNSYFVHANDQVQPDESETYIGLEHLKKGGGISGTSSALRVKSKKVIFKSGDVLYGKLRPYLNKHAYVEFDGVASTDILIYRSNFKESTKLLDYYLGLPQVVQYANANSSGINLPRVTPKMMNSLPIPLPPLNEQKRIADKVERLLNKIDEAKQLIDEAKETFELRRAAILDKAFRGELTAKWRSENPNLDTTEQLVESIKLDMERAYEENCKKAEKEGARKPRKTKVKIEKSGFESLYEGLPTNWKIVYFDEITAGKENALKAGPFGSALKKEFYVPSGYKIYGQEQVIKGDSTYGDYYINEEKYKELKSCAITKGDLLISLVGTIGKTLVIPEDYEPGIINPRLIKISLHEKINPYYIATYFESYLAKMIMSEGSHGGTMQILNMSILKKLPIPLPPKEEQDKILEVLNNLLSAELATKQIIEIEDNLANLKQSILSKAFRGELGTNDPSEESAIELLKTIISEK